MNGQPHPTSAEGGLSSAPPAVAWYLGRDGQQFGPVGDIEFRRLFETGQLLATDLVWREGFAEWLPVAAMQAPAPPIIQPPRPQPSTSPGQRRDTQSPIAYSERQPQTQPAITTRPQTTLAPMAADPATTRKAGANSTRRDTPTRKRGSSIGRGVAWAAIILFFAATLTAAYFVVASDKNLTRMVVNWLPTFGIAERIATTAPIGGFAKTPEATEQAMQKSLLWQVLKKYHAEWYGERVREATEAARAGKPDGEIATLMMQAVVKLRRQYAGDSNAAPVTRLKSIAELFAGNLARLKSQSVDACYQYVSLGEGAPVIVALLQTPEHTSGLQAQLAAIFEAAQEGRRSPRIYPQPKPTDYDALVTVLERRGWKDKDMQLFSDSKALALAPPEQVCRLVTDWFESQLALTDPDIQMRLLVDSLRPVVAG